MAGHSKWKQIRHQKGATDAKPGQLFTKLAREIAVAVRAGGPSPDGNYRLRLIMQKAKDSNMPMDNVERAIKRGMGGEGAEALEEVTYEGYGPGGVALMLHTLTSNRKRTVGEVRAGLTRAGGSLGESGSVAWNFDSKGVITVEADKGKGDDIALQAIDAGADDVKVEDGVVEVYTTIESLEKVRKALEAGGVNVTAAEMEMVPKTSVTVKHKEAEQTLRLLETLEELEDVQKVYSNADIPDEALEQYQQAG
jgi:YebC/PmpR family DNA-binding regulatory protein